MLFSALYFKSLQTSFKKKKKKPTRTHLNLLLCGPTQNPFNLIFDKIIKLIDDVTNLNNLGKLSPDKHFPGWRADTAGLA